MVHRVGSCLKCLTQTHLSVGEAGLPDSVSTQEEFNQHAELLLFLHLFAVVNM